MGMMTDPCHPGETLKHEFLEPPGISAIGLARATGMPRTRIERLVREQARATPDTAPRLAKALGTTPEFWITMQSNFDMTSARKTVDVSDIEPLVVT